MLDDQDFLSMPWNFRTSRTYLGFKTGNMIDSPLWTRTLSASWGKLTLLIMLLIGPAIFSSLPPVPFSSLLPSGTQCRFSDQNLAKAHSSQRIPNLGTPQTFWLKKDASWQAHTGYPFRQVARPQKICSCDNSCAVCTPKPRTPSAPYHRFFLFCFIASLCWWLLGFESFYIPLPSSLLDSKHTPY